MPGELRTFFAALPFLARNRALLTWQQDIGGVADALAAGCLVNGVPIDAPALHSRWKRYISSNRDANAVCEMIEGCVQASTEVLTWEPGRAILVSRSKVNLLELSPGHWVSVLQQNRHGWLMLDPDMGPVLFARHALDSEPRNQIVVTPESHKKAATERGASSGDISLGKRMLRLLPEVLVGLAVRLLLAVLLALLCIALFQIQQGATLVSLLMLTGLAVLAGGGLVLGRVAAFHLARGEGQLSQRHSFRQLLAGALRKRDLLGFRSQPEPLVTQKAMQQVISQDVANRGFGAALGAVIGSAALLAILMPYVSVALVMISAVFAVAHVADRVYVARPAQRGHARQHRRVSVINGALHTAKLVEFAGGLGKWGLVALAGVLFATGGLSDVALTFWVLAALILLPADLAHLNTVMKGVVFPIRPALRSALDVVTQRPADIAKPSLAVMNEPGVVYVDGLKTVMTALEQPDLTRAEQRNVACLAIENAVSNLDTGDATPGLRPVFLGMTPEMTVNELDQVDLDARIQTMRETADGRTASFAMVPVADGQTRALIGATQFNQATQDASETAYLIALRTCAPDELPVLLDLREQFHPDDVRRLGARAGRTQIAVLSMRRLSIYEVAA